MKTFCVTIKENDDTFAAEIYVKANQRIKAERIGILNIADLYEMKTSDLTATSEICRDKLNPIDFDVCVAVKKTGTGE